MQGGETKVFDSSASGAPDPFFTMPNTSVSLGTETGQKRQDRKGREVEKEEKPSIMKQEQKNEQTREHGLGNGNIRWKRCPSGTI